jgi:DNA-binding response OmpR family regulator
MGKEHLKPNEIVTAVEIPPRPQKEKEIKTLYMTPGDQGEEDAEVEHDTAPGDKTPGQKKNVILVVEDHAEVRKYIRDPLEPEYTVIEACDGKEGITKAKEIIPDLVVSDIMMPEADGFELTWELKKDVRTSHIPIILLTAKASEKSIVRGLETGADDYVTKPFNTKILLIRIKNLIELRRQLQLRIQRQKMLLPAEISVSSVDDAFLKEFQDIIEKNLSDPEFNIDMLYKKLYMGRSTLYRKVEALTGETPNQFILSYRLERAAQLLKSNYGNVTEVAMAAGFSNPQYFSQCFKEKFHQSPSSFKAA